MHPKTFHNARREVELTGDGTCYYVGRSHELIQQHLQRQRA
jgi:hypothetical protein